MKIFIAVLLLLCLAIPAYAEDEGVDARGDIVSSSHYDIDGDGELERVDIYLASGRRYVDDTDWCGKGEKWEGEFHVRITDNKKLLRDNPEPLHVEFFWLPAFELRFADYNSDGNVDFNVTGYSGCNLREVYLYTIYPGGRVERLDVDGDILASTSESSTGIVNALGDGCLTTQHTDDEQGVVQETWCWNSSMFFLKDTILVGGEEGVE
ncbi:MAG: hypothetical protein HZA22_08290 [Nitrospirae bacterium]|nr:hypothetical protein [Nitrospirota bacterium]